MNIDPKAILDKEQIEAYFSQTGEYTVEDSGDSLNIVFTKNGKRTSILLYKPSINFQQLIRVVADLQYNMLNNILD